jgi:hypothetical protein
MLYGNVITANFIFEPLLAAISDYAVQPTNCVMNQHPPDDRFSGRRLPLWTSLGEAEPSPLPLSSQSGFPG